MKIRHVSRAAAAPGEARVGARDRRGRTARAGGRSAQIPGPSHVVFRSRLGEVAAAIARAAEHVPAEASR